MVTCLESSCQCAELGKEHFAGWVGWTSFSVSCHTCLIRTLWVTVYLAYSQLKRTFAFLSLVSLTYYGKKFTNYRLRYYFSKEIFHLGGTSNFPEPYIGWINFNLKILSMMKGSTYLHCSLKFLFLNSTVSICTSCPIEKWSWIKY